MTTLDAEIRAARARGVSLRDVATDLARRTGLSRRLIYRRALALEGQ